MELQITDIEKERLHDFLVFVLSHLSQDDRVIDLLFEQVKSRQRDMLKFIPANPSGLKSAVYFAFDIIQQADANDEFDAKLKMLARICIHKQNCCRPPLESCADYLYWILEKVSPDYFSDELRLSWLKTIHFCIDRMDHHLKYLRNGSQ